MKKQAFKFPVQSWMKLPQRKKDDHPNTVCWYTINVVYEYEQNTDDDFTGYSCSENIAYQNVLLVYKQKQHFNIGI